MFEVNPDSAAECAQLNHINSPFAAFALADERLRFPNLPRELFLRKARVLSRLPQQFEEYGVLSRVDGLFHCVRPNATKSG
jgi:hypothetical protein